MRTRSVALSLNGATLALLALLLVTFVAFLGMTLFNTKGEPREALVAVSILNQGNWILPVSCGADIPYKPPMLAWCIAVFGWLNGGHVTEFLSRLPSALGAVVMLICFFRFYARRGSMAVAAVATLVAATTFELHRAATSCRVDMLLASFVVMAILAMYVTAEKYPGRWRLSFPGILLMSAGVLTKGPVGMLLPCGVLLVLELMKGERLWRAFSLYAVSGILALLLPAAWYLLAYQQGGDSFLELVLEENFGRFLGRMSYESHEHTFLYNFQTLATGIAPYTLLLLLGLAAWRRFRRPAGGVGQWWASLRSMPAEELLAVVASVVIFVFYCIPKSKRSVYLLPMYPFVAYGIAIYIRWMVHHAPRLLRGFGIFMAVVGVLASLAMILIMLGAVPAMGGDRVAAFFVEAQGLGPVSLLICCMAVCGILGSLRVLTRGGVRQAVQWMLLDIMIIYWVFSAAIQPMVLNPKSDRPMAAAIEAVAAPDDHIYGFMSADMLRYYTAGFYMNDRIEAIASTDRPLAPSGWIIVGDKDVDSLKRFVPQDVALEHVMEWPQKSCDNKLPAKLYFYETTENSGGTNEPNKPGGR